MVLGMTGFFLVGFTGDAQKKIKNIFGATKIQGSKPYSAQPTFPQPPMKYFLPRVVCKNTG